MKIKTTFLAAMLALGAAATLSATPWDAKYNPTGAQPNGAAPAKNSCVQTQLVDNPNRKGYVTRQEVTCKANCKAGHTSKACARGEGRKCAK